jgi:hypothetical protein
MGMITFVMDKHRKALGKTAPLASQPAGTTQPVSTPAPPPPPPPAPEKPKAAPKSGPKKEEEK